MREVNRIKRNRIVKIVFSIFFIMIFALLGFLTNFVGTFRIVVIPLLFALLFMSAILLDLFYMEVLEGARG